MRIDQGFDDISNLIYWRTGIALIMFIPIVGIAGYFLAKPSWVFVHLSFTGTLVLVSLCGNYFFKLLLLSKIVMVFTLYYLMLILWFSGVNQYNNGTAALLILGMISISVLPRFAILMNIVNFALGVTLINLGFDFVLVEQVVSYCILLAAGNTLLSILLSSHLHEKKTVEVAFQNAKKLSEIDPLTGLANRRHIESVTSALFENNGECVQETPSLVVLDIDHFKQVNDTFGHGVGDRVLMKVAALIKEVVRDDIIGRFGGEEFIVVLKGESKINAIKISERIRSHIANCNMNEIDGELDGVSVSIGVTMVKSEESFRSAFERADRALYQAKSLGRNRVEFF